jgi:hypothetical protein
MKVIEANQDPNLEILLRQSPEGYLKIESHKTHKKAGRKPLSAQEKRSYRVLVSFNKAEYDSLLKSSEKYIGSLGVTLPQIIRSLLKEHGSI